MRGCSALHRKVKRKSQRIAPMRVGIISLIHESNTFAVAPTTIESFRRDSLLIGEQVRRSFEKGLHQISGFFEGLEHSGIEAVPIFHASTLPSGPITCNTCEELMRLMLNALEEAGPLDGLLVSPHGANAGEGLEFRDLDGSLVRRSAETGSGTRSPSSASSIPTPISHNV